MVSPGRIGEVNRLDRVEIGKKLSSNPTSPRSTESLSSGNGGEVRILPIGEFDSLLDERRVSHDARVLLVAAGIGHHGLLRLGDGGEDPGFAVLIAVGSDADVDFVGVGAGFEVFGDSEDGVGGSHGDVGQVGFGRSGGWGCHREGFCRCHEEQEGG